MSHQFLTQYRVCARCGHAECPATESVYWLMIHGRLLHAVEHQRKARLLVSLSKRRSMSRTLNRPLVRLSSFILTVVMAITPNCKAGPGCCSELRNEALSDACPALRWRLPNLTWPKVNVLKGSEEIVKAKQCHPSVKRTVISNLLSEL